MSLIVLFESLQLFSERNERTAVFLVFKYRRVHKFDSLIFMKNYFQNTI